MSKQNMEALALANRQQVAQAAILRELRALPRREGSERAAELLREPCDVIGAVYLDRLLGNVPFYGPDSIRRLLTRAGVPQGRPTRRVRELSEREREMLAGTLLAMLPRDRMAA